MLGISFFMEDVVIEEVRIIEDVVKVFADCKVLLGLIEVGIVDVLEYVVIL